MSEQDNTLNASAAYDDEGVNESRGHCTEYHGGTCSGKCKLYKHAGSHVCNSCGQTWG